MTAQSKRPRSPAQQKKMEDDKPSFVKVGGKLYEMPSLDTMNEGEKVDLELAIGPQLTQLLEVGGLGFVSALAFAGYRRVEKDATWEEWLTLSAELDPKEAKNGRPTQPAPSEEPTPTS